MRFLLLVLHPETGKWYVAEQSDDPHVLFMSGKALLDEDPMTVYRLFDVDASD